MPIKKLFLVFTILSVSLFAPLIVSAQEFTTGTAESVVVQADRTVEAGDIISVIDGVYVLSDTPFDSNLYGVVTATPALVMEDLALEGDVFVVAQGEAFVKVTSSNGAIQKGDFITSSEVAGVGQKADVSGQVVGISLQGFDSEDPTVINDILVQVDVRANVIAGNVRVNLVEALRSGTQAPFMTPLTSLRYILAALVTGGSFVLGFSSFGKTSGSGVEALGRNPLAHKAIQRSIVMNMVLTAVIMLVGLVLAYLILVL